MPLKSTIEYSVDTDFPLENIPFGVFSTLDGKDGRRCGSRIGDFVVDLVRLADTGLFDKCAGLESGKAKLIFSQPTLNQFMALGKAAWSQCRLLIQQAFTQGSPVAVPTAQKCLIAVGEVRMHLPADIGDYTDFYASKEHATNVGIMFRGKENALMPNWTRLPVGYHGRASSIVVSGTPLKRPCGQRNVAPKGSPEVQVVYGPSVRMDFELEVAFLIGTGNQLGDRVPLSQAVDHVFGVVLMNDWSARDIQAWEYVPLGPFLGKNFGTSISAWVVTMDALEPFFCIGPQQDPEPLPYLNEGADRKTSIDVQLQVAIRPDNCQEYSPVSNTNLKYMYWSVRQQIAHHTVNGCNLRTGDLLATGTISGPREDSYGSLLELSWSGQKRIQLKDGQERTFLNDGDEVRISGFAQGPGYRVGFGECSGVILPATP